MSELHRLVAAQVAKATRASGELDTTKLCDLMSCCYEEMELNRRRVDRANKLMQEELTQMTDDLERLVEELRVRNVTLLAEITERKLLESQLVQAQKLESIGQLAAGIAHEINTPIQYVGDSVEFLRSAVASIDGVLEQYRQELHALPESASSGAMLDRLRAAEEAAELNFLRAEMPRAFERSLEGVVRVAKIVRAMKEFSFPDAHEHCYANINQALETTLIVAHNEYKLVARIDAQYGELPDVKCNISELNQVFLNLVVNAAHAIQDSGKDVLEGVIAVRTALDGDLVEIAIGDNGCGVAPEIANKIFDPFFTTKEVGRGTGQGLSIARATVVTRHGGTLSFETGPGRGTTFFVRLPVHGPASEGGCRESAA
jgi:signal transduction histidine kinase